MRTSLIEWNQQRLRLWLGLFFLSLAVPTGVLVYQAYGQLKWEAFHQQQTLAGELSARIDSSFQELIKDAEAQSFTDYGFLVVAGDPSANFLQPSPLADFPVSSAIPGLLGYFQISSDGRFSTPFVPDSGTDAGSYGVSTEELAARTKLETELFDILARNQLVQQPPYEYEPEDPTRDENEAALETASPAAPSAILDQQPAGIGASVKARAKKSQEIASQAAFDRLSQSAASEVKQQWQDGPGRPAAPADADKEDRKKASDDLQRTTAARQPDPSLSGSSDQRRMRKELAAIPEAILEEAPEKDEGIAYADLAGRELRLSLFESEIDPFEFSALESGHFVLFRKVWRDGKRYIQGILIDQQPLLQEMVGSPLGQTTLATSSDLAVTWQDRVISVFRGHSGRGYVSTTENLEGTSLYQTHLSSPLNEVEMRFNVIRLPSPAGTSVVVWLAVLLAVLLVGGFLMMYRLGLRQIELARQQQDFVSAVSHELKTPLTSIRMYGEMLREGWASEEKKRSYYDYIHDESERLSRLINNVLQLARMTRNDLKLDNRPVSVHELVDGIASKVSSQVQHAGFHLNLDCSTEVSDLVVTVDTDAFSQIIINLVDNAIKFSRQATTKRVDIVCARSGNDKVRISVRDYGPGVAGDQMKKIFRLFYRSENELTRETVGTGIGLALVSQLAQSMGGTVDIVNRDPGAEFSVVFPQKNVQVPPS